MKNTPPCAQNNYHGKHVQLLLSSFHQLTGNTLIDHKLPKDDQYKALLYAPFCVVSHGTEADPIFNYGNNAALSMFEMNWQDFTSLESRHSAEPQTQQERQQLLTQVSQNGFIDNYQGVRVSSTGTRFFVEKAVVWNVVDVNGRYRGQAAVLYEWSKL